MALDVVSLKELIKDSKKTQTEIAEEMKMSTSQFSQKVNGARRFTVPEALRLAEILKLDLKGLKNLWKGEE